MTIEHEFEQQLQNVRIDTSAELDDRILGDAQKRQAARLAGIRFPFAFNGRFRNGVAVGAAVAVIIGVFLVWAFDPNDSWAQVASAVKLRPWIQITGEPEVGQIVEQWFSIDKMVMATRSKPAGYAELHDLRNHSHAWYEPGEKILYVRTDDPGSVGQEFDFMKALLESLFRGDERLDFEHKELVEQPKQERRMVEAGGRSWIEYTITFPDDRVDTATIRIRVDPDTMLPRSLIAESKPGYAGAPARMEARIDYPEQGPADIYELGVPREAKVVDLSSNGNALTIIKLARQSAAEFDDHSGIGVITEGDAPWYRGTPFRIWRKGAKWRMDYGIADPLVGEPEPPAAEVDRHAWWKARCERLWFLPSEVSDGKHVWSNIALAEGSEQARYQHPIIWPHVDWPPPNWESRKSSDNWPAETGPLTFGYPPQLARQGRTVEKNVQEHPAEGPQGCVLLTIRDAGLPPEKILSGTEKFWIDPNRGCITVKYQAATDFFRINSDLKRSPKSIWYPARVQNVDLRALDGKDRTGLTLWFYLEFDAELPDELFTPADRIILSQMPSHLEN